jgi:hypothetical protein
MRPFLTRLMSGFTARGENEMKPVVKPRADRGASGARRWLDGLSGPELWEVVDEALLRTAAEYPIMSKFAERWVSMPERIRTRMDIHLREALRRRMPPS